MAGFETAQVLSLVIGVVLPLIVGYVTKESMAGGAKAILLAALSGVSGFLTEMLDAVTSGGVFNWQSTLLAVLGTFLVATGSHFGFWKPTGVSGVAQRAGVKDKYDLAA